MANDKVYIFDDDNIKINVYEEGQTDLQIINENPSIEIIRIYEQGAQGPRGEDGTAQIPDLVVTSSNQIDFYLIQNAPFYPIISGSLFGTTASFAFFGTISSSLLPWSSSFDLGSVTSPWKNVYVSNSLHVGHTIVTTSSFGFDDYVVKRISSEQTIFKLISGSVSSSFNDDGQFLIPKRNNLPNQIYEGSLLISGSDFFIGI